MNTNVNPRKSAWGSNAWIFLHSVAYNYPDRPTQAIVDAHRTFFTSLAHVLPCCWCRDSYSQYMEALPIEPALRSRRALCDWLYRIHNMTNAKLGKMGPSLREVDAYYEAMRADDRDALQLTRGSMPALWKVLATAFLAVLILVWSGARSRRR
ncbi:g2872 [Coccomyxa elongata]